MARRVPIHTRVKIHVEQNGLTVGELADLAGWTYLRTLRLMLGRTRLLADDIETIARVLDCEVADLYDEPSTSGAQAS